MDEAREMEEWAQGLWMQARGLGIWARGLCERVRGLWKYEHVGSAEEYVDSGNTSTWALLKSTWTLEIRARGLYKRGARLKKGSAHTQKYEINSTGVDNDR